MQLIKNYIIRICFIFTIIIANISFATASNDAANYINDLAERVINIVKKTDLEEKEKESILNEIFIQNVDVKWIGRFAMGKFWRRITPDQQEKFLTIYSDYLTGLYVPNFR
ncbi:MAG: ABC transporter substrate-binding protein, partial [Pseudomonadota bacterium]